MSDTEDGGVADLFRRYKNGRYTIGRVLGEGGMGFVLLAIDELLGRGVAIKFIQKAYLGSKMIRSRFMAEARVTALLRSPYIVEVQDVDEFEGNLFIIMELLEGGTLTDHLRAFGALPPRKAVQVIIAILKGMRVAHGFEQRGVLSPVVHRDGKPDNVIFAKPKHGDEVIKLADFGIAGADTAQSTRHTKAGSAMGTMGYMPPEQKADAKSADPRADIHAVGVMLWMVCSWVTGECEIPGTNDFYLVIDKLGRMDRVPEAFKPIIAKATACDPGDRYQSADDMIAALSAILPTLPELPEDTPLFGTAPMVADRNPEAVSLRSEPTDPGLSFFDQRSLVADEAAVAAQGGGALQSVVAETTKRPPPPALGSGNTFAGGLPKQDGVMGTFVGSELDSNELEDDAQAKTSPGSSWKRLAMIAAVLMTIAAGIGLWVRYSSPVPEPVVVANVDPPETPIQDPPVSTPAPTGTVDGAPVAPSAPTGTIDAAPDPLKMVTPDPVKAAKAAKAVEPKSKAKAAKVKVAEPEAVKKQMARVSLSIQGDASGRVVEVWITDSEGKKHMLTTSKRKITLPVGGKYAVTYKFKGAGGNQSMGALKVDSTMVTIECDWDMVGCRKL
ncbi:serine/threonine protein kinase [Candidatus Uhrbacteria bacterium]|jgi:serine/threonine protein kinase|nr:serine/threonine protein kinase [Candidatus Uhrbacteria bacterium]